MPPGRGGGGSWKLGRLNLIEREKTESAGESKMSCREPKRAKESQRELERVKSAEESQKSRIESIRAPGS